MIRFLLDTDILSLLEQGHASVLRNVNAHAVDEIAISAITIQEQMKGFLAAVNRARGRHQLARAYEMLVNKLCPIWKRFAVITFAEPAVLRFEQLKSQCANIGSMDLRTAAIALGNFLTVVTRNQRDFGRIPGVITVDWFA